MIEEFAVPVCLALGNKKVGRVWTFSLPSIVTCPGASDWCREHCYARRIERYRPNCRRAYVRNLALSMDPEKLIASVLDVLPEDAEACRIHVGGDLYSVEYTDAWRRICKARPSTQFWAYTRSWSQPELCEALDRLRALPNVELFASTDTTMPLPPKGWRVAFIEGDDRATGLACPHQEGQVASCLECGYCFRKKTGNVIFKTH